MKKLLVLVLALALAISGVAMAESTKGEGVMTYEEYLAAELYTEVTIEAYVQATQGWWEDNGQGVQTVYAQDEDGAYFIYNKNVPAEDKDALVPGTKIKVTGTRTEWEGEVEIDAGATFEILEGSYIAEAKDVTDLIGTDELIDYQNQFVTMKGLTVKAVEYQNDTPGKDIYVSAAIGDKTIDLCVESYLTTPDSEVYTTVGELAEGDVIDVEGFLYWYQGANPHITKVTKAAAEEAEVKGEGVMTYEEYLAAELYTEVTIEAYVQATQGWWEDNGQGVQTVYAQDKDGAYFIYNMNVPAEDKDALVPGTKIKVTGTRTEWEGEVEIDAGATFEILEGSYIAEAKDVTDLIGTDELITYQNQLVSMKGLTVKSVAYQNDTPGKDIYVSAAIGDKTIDLCVESYLTTPDSELYAAVGELAEGDVIDVEGFLYWYQGANPHITKVTKAAE